MYDASDVSFGSSTFTPMGVTIYDDRPLTRWEWVKVKVLRRKDPRVLPAGQGTEGSFVVTWDSSGRFHL